MSAYINISDKTILELIKESISNSQDSIFLESLIRVLNKEINLWNTELDYNLIKKLNKTTNKVLKDFDN